MASPEPPPISKPILVRLLAAVLGSAGCMWFVVSYSACSNMRFNFEHPDNVFGLMYIVGVVVDDGQWLFFFPALAAIVGIWLVWRHPKAETTFEILIWVIWMLSLGLVAFCLLVWQAQNIPVYTHGEWHF